MMRAESFCFLPGEEAHQRLLPQPHVPSGAPLKPRGPPGIEPPGPLVPRSSIGRHRRGCVGLLSSNLKKDNH